MKELNVWIPVIIAIISGTISPIVIQFVNDYKKRRIKKLLNIIEDKTATEYFTDCFKEKFITREIEETYFFIQTGIETNHSSIYNYINLKEKLGHDFIWKQIREAKPHLKFKHDTLQVTINKFQTIVKNIGLIMVSISFLLSLFLSINLDTESTTTFMIILIKLFITIIPICFGLLIIYFIQSLLAASNIERRLRDLDKLTSPPTPSPSLVNS